MITELVKMKTMNNIGHEEFLTIVNDLEIKFHSGQPGYIDSELMFDERNNEYLMLQHWENIDDMKCASSKMFSEDITLAFRNALDPKQVKIEFFPQINAWCK